MTSPFTDTKPMWHVALAGLAGFLLLTVVIAVKLSAPSTSTPEAIDRAERAQARDLAERIHRHALEMRRREKDFLSHGRNEDIVQHGLHMHDLSQALERLEVHPALGAHGPRMTALSTTARRYKQGVDELERLTLRIGVNESSGLLGDLRRAIHAVEAVLARHDAERLTVIMLMMRRHEKDFLARVRPVYLEKMAQRTQEFAAAMATSGLPEIDRRYIAGLLERYQRNFRLLAESRLNLAGQEAEVDDIFAGFERDLSELIGLLQPRDSARAPEVPAHPPVGSRRSTLSA